MFCNGCGKMLNNPAAFCPYCGAKTIGSLQSGAAFSSAAPAPARTVAYPVQRSAYQPTSGMTAMLCSGCGARLSVKEGTDIVTCEFCGTSFVLNQPQRTVIQSPPVTVQVMPKNISPEEKAAASVKNFLTELQTFRESTRQRLIPQTVRGFFGKTRPGTIEDVSDDQLGEAVGEFIYRYEIPHDEQTLTEFFLLSLKYSREDAYGEEVDVEEQHELNAWTKKNEEIQNLLKTLYPNSQRVKEITKKSFRKQMKSYLNDDSGLDDVIGVIGAAGTLFGIAKGLKRFL